MLQGGACWPRQFDDLHATSVQQLSQFECRSGARQRVRLAPTSSIRAMCMLPPSWTPASSERTLVLGDREGALTFYRPGLLRHHTAEVSRLFL